MMILASDLQLILIDSQGSTLWPHRIVDDPVGNGAFCVRSLSLHTAQAVLKRALRELPGRDLTIAMAVVFGDHSKVTRRNREIEL